MKQKPKKKLASAAIVTIHRADEMSPEGRKEIAAWLRRHAAFILKHGHDYAKRFTGRYMHEETRP